MGRFSLRWLFVATAFVASAVFAILNPGMITAAVTNVVATASVAIAIVVVLRHWWRAPFALGFVVAALADLLMSAGTAGWTSYSLAVTTYPMGNAAADPMESLYRAAIVSRVLQVSLGIAGGWFAQWVASRDSKP
ncbi:MAG: hypothetical protein U0836_09370 [Pirellulales bacterium]